MPLKVIKRNTLSIPDDILLQIIQCVLRLFGVREILAIESVSSP